MKERDIELKKLCACEFSLWDMHLYLDTHPEDLRMVERYNKSILKYSLMKHDFEEKYFPLCSETAKGVEWLKAPWPWDNEECGC